MALKDILVHIDNSPHSATRLALAVGLAQRHKAHLTGLYVIPHPHYLPEHGNYELDAEDAQASFELETIHSGIESEWRCIDWNVSGVGMAEIVNINAYHMDLVIVGQPSEGASGVDTPSDLIERLVVGSGRPILVVPTAGVFNTVGERLMVAWKAGRESVRSLNDSMPLMQKAQEVGLLIVNSSSFEEASCSDISKHLARHDIMVKIEKFVAAGVPVGDVLLNQAWENGCDLLVMGACTHNSRGTLSLSSVTRHVLKHMTIPVLMSH